MVWGRRRTCMRTLQVRRAGVGRFARFGERDGLRPCSGEHRSARCPAGQRELADLSRLLDPVDALADGAPGIRWRLQDEEGNATHVVAFESEVGDAVGLITNMSTWQDVASLAAFVVGPMHAAIMRRRREWFLPFREAYTTCWWVPAGHCPSVGEAEDRLQLLVVSGRPGTPSFCALATSPDSGA